MDTVAHNIANMSTPGFRATGTKFETLVSTVADDVSFASAGKSYIKTDAGPIIQTDNPLDVAVKGDAWLSLSAPQGQVYTRDGRMTMSADGEIRSVKGYPVLDAGGQPLMVNPNGGPVKIGADGAIYQNNAQVGAIGLFTISKDAKLTYADNSAVISSIPAEPVVDTASVGVVQGAIEGSNVDSITEMTRLISVSRAFERVDALLRESETTFSKAIQTLGSKT